jgi:hypothetical protein
MRDAATVLEIIRERGTTMSTGKPDATEIGHVRFGGGPSEKDQFRYLAGGLPYFTPRSVRARG